MFDLIGPKGTSKLLLVTWKEYKNTLVQGKGPAWNKMIDSDIVIGGYGIEADFL